MEYQYRYTAWQRKKYKYRPDLILNKPHNIFQERELLVPVTSHDGRIYFDINFSDTRQIRGRLDCSHINTFSRKAIKNFKIHDLARYVQKAATLKILKGIIKKF